MSLSPIILIASVFLSGLLYFEKQSSIRGRIATKPVVSLMFLFAALSRDGVDPGYTTLVVAALVCCMVGDICLIFMDSRAVFLVGLISFLLGHAVYIAAFFPFLKLTWVTAAVIGAAAIAGFRVYQWLEPDLGKMKIPVIAYIIVISVMLICAVSVSANTRLPMIGRSLVVAGAIGFYVSDIFVARNQFAVQSFVNRLIGLPLYYLAQFLLAVSVAHIG